MSFIESLPQRGVKKAVGYKPKGKPRGRPKGSHKVGGVFTTIRVSENLKAILELEHKPGERYSDTVERMLYEKAQKIKVLAQENDRLGTLLEQEVQGNDTTNKIIIPDQG